MSLAVGNTIVFEEMGFHEWRVTHVTGEVVRVPYFSDSSYGTTFARLTATSTFLEEQNFIVRCTVIIPFEFMAISSLELLTTFFTSKVSRMHELSLDQQIRSDNRTVAHGTHV